MDLSQVYSTLQQVNFSLYEERKHAMKLLESYEQINGFITILTQILLHKDLFPISENRQLAAISIKNVVKRYWSNHRSYETSTGIIIEDIEKETLRSFLLTHYEDIDIVSVQLSRLTAEVAMKDWPEGWPALLPALFSAIQPIVGDRVNEWKIQVRAMKTLFQVIELLNEKKLGVHKQAFIETSVNVFPILAFQIWIPLSNEISLIINEISNIDNNNIELQATKILLINKVIPLSCHLLILTKILGIVIDKGYAQLYNKDALPSFFNSFVGTLQNYCMYLRSLTSLAYLRSLISDRSEDNDGVPSDDEDNDEESDDDKEYDINNNKGTEIIMLYKVFRQITKHMSYIPTKIQKNYSLQLVPLLSPFLQFYYTQLNDECNNNGILNSLQISSIIFISKALACSDYSDSPKLSLASRRNKLENKILLAQQGIIQEENEINLIEDELSTYSKTGYLIINQFFTEEVISTLLSMLVNKLLHLNKSELEQWVNDPEALIMTLPTLMEEDSIKCAAEGLYCSLMDKSPELITQKLISFIKDIDRQLEVSKVGCHYNDVMLWDSIYLCMGLFPYYFVEKISPTEWLTSAAGPILNNLLSHHGAGGIIYGTNYIQILRSRLIWLIGCWSYKFDVSVFPQILSMLISLCEKGSGSDVITMMHAVGTISAILDTENFDPTILIPVLVRLIEALCILTLNDLSEGDSQSTVIDLVRKLINVMGIHLRPLLTPLAQHLIRLWSGSDINSPLRISILETFTEMVKQAGNASIALYDLAIPLIEVSLTNSNGDDSSYLLKDGISLWLAIARNIPYGHYNELLDSLVKKYLISIFTNENNEFDLSQIMLILEAYAISGGSTFLNSCSLQLRDIFILKIGQVKYDLIPYLMRPIEALLLSCPIETCLFLLQSGLLNIILKYCSAAIPELKETMQQYQEHNIGFISYYSIFARILLLQSTSQLGDNDILMSSINNLMGDINCSIIGNVGTCDGNVLLKCYLRYMLDNFDSVGYSSSGTWRRKLWCLSLLSMYPTVDKEILEVFPEVINISIDVICEEESDEGKIRSKGLVNSILSYQGMNDCYDSDDNNNNDEETEPIIISMTLLMNRDIVINSNVNEIVVEKLGAVLNTIGNEEFSKFVSIIGENSLQRFM